MIITVEDRAVLFGEYIVEKGATVRSTARNFHISKSTVHKDVSERLKKINPALYKKVRKILEENKAERHIRGGIATRNKYKSLIIKKRRKSRKTKRTIYPSASEDR